MRVFDSVEFHEAMGAAGERMVSNVKEREPGTRQEDMAKAVNSDADARRGRQCEVAAPGLGESKFLDLEITRALFHESDLSFEAKDYAASTIWNRAALLAMKIGREWHSTQIMEPTQ